MKLPSIFHSCQNPSIFWNASQSLSFPWSHAYSSQQITPSSAECLRPWLILVKLIVSVVSNKIMFMKVFLRAVQCNNNWDSMFIEHLLWASQYLWRLALCSITYALCSSSRLELPRAVLFIFIFLAPGIVPVTKQPCNNTFVKSSLRNLHNFCLISSPQLCRYADRQWIALINKYLTSLVCKITVLVLET